MNALSYIFVLVLVAILAIVYTIRGDNKEEEKKRHEREKRRNRIDPVFEVSSVSVPQTEDTPKPHSYATFVPSLSTDNASKKPD